MTIQVNSLVLVDDHILFREGMKELISHWDDFEVVGEAANGLIAGKFPVMRPDQTCQGGHDHSH